MAKTPLRDLNDFELCLSIVCGFVCLRDLTVNMNWFCADGKCSLFLFKKLEKLENIKKLSKNNIL